MSYQVKLFPSDIEFTTTNLLLDDALAQKVILEHSCKNGQCGVCTAEIISGKFLNEQGEIVKSGKILTCQSKALSDVTLGAEYYPELANIEQQTIPCKVKSIHYPLSDVLLLTLRFPPNVDFRYLAGQYIDLHFQGINRSYSIANIWDEEKTIELHIRNVVNGQMSQRLFGEVQENQLMRIQGPKGTFFVRSGSRPLIFIATGTGIAPVKAMVEQLVANNDPREVCIYWGMQTQNQLYCTSFIDWIEMQEHISFYPVCSQESINQREAGYVQYAVLNDFSDLSEVDIYACGSPLMIEQAKELFMAANLPLSQFHFDAFTPATV